MHPPSKNILRYAELLVIILICLFCTYSIISSIVIHQTTGALNVASTDSNATLSITQANHQAVYIGKGKSAVRLSPGSYIVSAADRGRQVLAKVQIAKKQSAKISLSNPKTASVLPSEEDINFGNIDNFTSQGLTATQVISLKLDIFKFDHTAHSVSVNFASIKQGMPSPGNFTFSFSITIDNTPYNATIDIPGLITIQLSVFNAKGALVYSSANS